MPPTTLDDPHRASTFYGLLSDPPGEWSLCRHGPNGLQWVLLRGSPEFHRRAFNLFDSFVGGADRAIETRRFEVSEVVAVSLNQSRILRALHLFFWGQIVSRRGEIRPVTDDEGDEIDIEVMNAAWLEREADRLAAAFYRHMDETPCPVNPNLRDDSPAEARVMVCRTGVDDDDDS